jgi:hypothetical protein
MRLPRDAWPLFLLLPIAARSRIFRFFSLLEKHADLPQGMTEGHDILCPL